jgi:hypothetical protein
MPASLILTHLLSNACDSLIHIAGHSPVTDTTADVVDKTIKQILAFNRVRDLGMKLHCVKAACLVRHPCNRARSGRGHDFKALRQARHLIAVAHPDLEHAVALGCGEVLDPVEQTRMTTGTHLGVAELAVIREIDLATQLLGHRLHAIANAEDRHTRLEHGMRDLE